jgi:hypothetical protein
VRARAS